MRVIIILLMLVLFLGCAEQTYYAPVTEAGAIEPIPKNGTYRVLPGETLYSIAWRYGLDYRYLAKQNSLRHYSVRTGQLLNLRARNTFFEKSKPRSLHKKIPRDKLIENEPKTVVTQWRWPAKGDIIRGYSSANKGLNIAGDKGDPIFASAAGKVVYSGHGLRGYGNLIIIKHNEIYLTAYAHNNSLLVKEGDRVLSGQKIATMGNTGTNRFMLHFEIRCGGKPVNPTKYLTPQPKPTRKLIAYFSPLPSWLRVSYNS